MTAALTGAASTVARVGGRFARQVHSALDPSAERPAGTGPTASGWLAVTVLRDQGDIDLAHPPAPLAELGERVRLHTRVAPGGKGTELAARLRDPQPTAGALDRLRGTDPQGELRSALRQAKQLLEVGEVLVVDPTPHGRRPATPGGALVDAWTRAAPKAGVR